MRVWRREREGKRSRRGGKKRERERSAKKLKSL